MNKCLRLKVYGVVLRFQSIRQPKQMNHGGETLFYYLHYKLQFVIQKLLTFFQKCLTQISNNIFHKNCWQKIFTNFLIFHKILNENLHVLNLPLFQESFILSLHQKYNFTKKNKTIIYFYTFLVFIPKILKQKKMGGAPQLPKFWGFQDFL